MSRLPRADHKDETIDSRKMRGFMMDLELAFYNDNLNFDKSWKVVKEFVKKNFACRSCGFPAVKNDGEVEPPKKKR